MTPVLGPSATPPPHDRHQCERARACDQAKWVVNCCYSSAVVATEPRRSALAMCRAQPELPTELRGVAAAATDQNKEPHLVDPRGHDARADTNAAAGCRRMPRRGNWSYAY